MAPGSKRGRVDSNPIGAARAHSQPPPPTKHPTNNNNDNDYLKFAIFVGGFGRKVPSHFRQVICDEMLSKLSSNIKPKATPKVPHLSHFFYLSFPDKNSVYDALDSLQTYAWVWNDPYSGMEQKLYLKRHKELQLREVGKFRHIFYQAVDVLFKANPMTKGQFKLKFNAGTLYIEIYDDALPLLSFTRELIKDKSGLEADYTTFQYFKVEQSEVDSLICSCLLLVEDDELD